MANGQERIDEETDSDREESSGGQYLPRTKYRQDAFVETYKSLSLIIVEGLKLLALANGGGAIALLSFLSSDRARPLPDLTVSLTVFASGLFVTILAFGATYLTQMFIFKLINQPKEKQYALKHKRAFAFALFFLLLSAGLFVVGVFTAAIAYAPN